MEVPLELWNRPHWELTGQPDIALFFRKLPVAFPNATTLFIEGTAIVRDIDEFLRAAADPGDYLPKRQTLLPKPKQYRVRFDGPTLSALANFAELHAEPQLLDH